MTKLEKEKYALDMIDQGQNDLSIEPLYELIVEYAQEKNFNKADTLLQTLTKANPMAINKIIEAGEVLEKQQSKYLDVDHIRFWKGLYESFSDDEISGFYYALKKGQLKPGKILIKQGKLNDKLFFINRGRLNTICHSGKKQMFIKEISAGEAVGLSSFFFMSIATTTVMTESRVDLNYLTYKAFSDLQKKIPGFDEKIQNQCKNLVRIDTADSIQQKKIERRTDPRFSIKGKVIISTMDNNGKPDGQPINGVIEDLSCGGASFSIKHSSSGKLRGLLGRVALIKIVPDDNEKGELGTKRGRIVSLQDKMFDNYSISFKFAKPLPREILHH